MCLIERPRRLRSNPVIRGMVQETRVSLDTLIYPLFVIEGDNIKEEIPSMPGQYRYSIDRIGEELDKVCLAGVGRRWHCAKGAVIYQETVSGFVLYYGCVYV